MRYLGSVRWVTGYYFLAQVLPKRFKIICKTGAIHKKMADILNTVLKFIVKIQTNCVGTQRFKMVRPFITCIIFLCYKSPVTRNALIWKEDLWPFKSFQNSFSSVSATTHSFFTLSCNFKMV